MKKATLYIFLFTMVLRTLYAQFHYAFYLIDSETYIELFCENQDKPEMHCDGKCSLSKATKETSKSLFKKSCLKGIIKNEDLMSSFFVM